MASEARSVKTPGLEIWVAGNCSAFGIPPSHRLNESKQDEERQGSLLHPLGSPSQSRISAMSAGAHHVVICCADKTLWATGSNMFGQLGTGVDGVNQKELALLDVRLPIVSVSCGKDHTVVVTLYGEMLACGNNTSGQLGLGDFEDRVVLTKSDLMDMSIISVAAGDHFPPSIAIASLHCPVSVYCQLLSLPSC
jgi:alpha-tubulin suppressor-like RCC1 family protein